MYVYMHTIITLILPKQEKNFNGFHLLKSCQSLGKYEEKIKIIKETSQNITAHKKAAHVIP